MNLRIGSRSLLRNLNEGERTVGRQLYKRAEEEGREREKERLERKRSRRNNNRPVRMNEKSKLGVKRVGGDRSRSNMKEKE
jgi:hypothetical protein